MKILFLAPYPAYESPSQRYRFEHYLPYLDEKGISYTYKPFLSKNAWQIFFKPGNVWRKGMGVLSGFVRRFFQLFVIARYDYVFIHREATPIGPPVFEWIIAKLFRKKIIYDFDDAIWIPATSSYNKIASKLKNFGKVAKICKWSYKVCVGNDYLGDFARQYNNSIVLVPTVVNTLQVHNQLQDQDIDRPSVGWTGTFSTLQYLDIVLPVLQQLQDEIAFTFFVIADKDPQLPLKHYEFIKWRRETEAADLLRFHIGLMPLYDNEIAKGKCGFKAIQYMSLGIPAVVSPVGVNSIIVDNTKNGFVCASTDDWYNTLKQLLIDTKLRVDMGMAAQQKIQMEYSVEATKEKFVALFS